MNRRHLIYISAIVAILMITPGCFWLIAGAAGGAGGYAWTQGKLSFVTPHSVTRCHDATIPALQSLGIYIASDNTDKLAGIIKGRTAAGAPVTVDLEPQEGNLTKVEIRVGYWGDKVQSQKIADEIKSRLK